MKLLALLMLVFFAMWICAQICLPLKMSTTIISYEDLKVKVNIKLIAEDLTKGIKKYSSANAIYLGGVMNVDTTEALKKYINENLEFYSIGQQSLDFEYQNVYMDHGNSNSPVIHIEMLSKNNILPSDYNNLKIKNTLLFQNNLNQRNIVKFNEVNKRNVKDLIFTRKEKSMFQDVVFS